MSFLGGMLGQEIFSFPLAWLCLGAGILGSLCFLLAGAIRFESQQSFFQKDIVEEAKYYRRQMINLRGMIISEVALRRSAYGKKTVFTLRVRQVKTLWGWKKIHGKVKVNLYREDLLSYGDEIEIQGKIHPPYDFSDQIRISYRDSLRRKGIHYLLSVKKDAAVRTIASGKGRPWMTMILKQRQRFKHIL